VPLVDGSELSTRTNGCYHNYHPFTCAACNTYRDVSADDDDDDDDVYRVLLQYKL